MAESSLYKYSDPSYVDFLKTLRKDEDEEKEEEISFAVPQPVTDVPDEDRKVSTLEKYSDPAYLKSRGIERPMDEEFDFGDISTERRMLYGAEQETTLTGNIIRYAQALGNTLSEEGTTFTGSLQDIEDERQREIFKKFREFRGIRQRDEDAAILAGRIGVAIADPITWVLPWAKVAKAGKIASMAMGAGVSATDEALREQLVYGEINPLTVGAATVLGGAGGALGAALARNKVPALGVQKVEEVMASPAGAQSIPLNVSGTTRDVVRDYQRRFWMGVSDEEFDAVEEATERVVPKSVVEDIELNNPSHTRMVDGINKLRDKVLELNKLIGVTTSSSKKALLKKEVDVAKKQVNEATERVYKGMKERATGRADSTLAIQEDLSANGKLTEGITQRMVHELTRPVIGGIGGYVASGFIGDEDSSAWTWGLMGAGMAAGQYQKILQRSKLTDFEKGTAKMALEEGIVNNFNRVLKVATAGTTVARLDAMGGWAKVLGNLLFNRQGATTDSVEAMVHRHQREFGRDLLDTFGESAEDIHIRQAVGEVMNEFTDIDSIRVGYTGIADNLKPLTEAQVSEIRRIVPLANVLQDTLRRGMDEVGVTFTRLEHYGMAQLWNKVSIGKDVGKFTDDLTHAMGIQTGKIEVEGIVKPSDIFVVNRTLEDLEEFRKIGDPSSSTRYAEMFDNPRYFKEEKDRVAEVVVMTPAEYIKRAAQLLRGGKGVTEQEVRRQRRFDKPSNIKMREAMEEGQQFTAPYLDYGSISQEGLNRAINAEQLGIKNMPVVVITKVADQDAIIKSIPRPPVERYTKLPKKRGQRFQVQAFVDNIRGIKRLKTGRQRYTQTSSFEEGGKFRPLTAHFEHERKLVDTDARKFMAGEGWIDMDALNVLTVYADKSIKAMEFARVFGAKGEFFKHAFKDIRRAFRNAGDPKLLPFEDRYRKQMIDSVDAFWGKYGKADGAYSSLGSSTMSILVFLANTNYLPRVGITSLADLVQPFQNSGVGSSTKAILSRLKPGEIPFSKQIRFRSEGAWEREYTALQTADADPFSSLQSTLRDWNQKFFKIVQLQRVTVAARDFAYDTGVLQAHKLSKDVTKAGGKISKGVREEMGSLGMTGDDLTVLGRFKTAQEAFSSTEGNVILDRIGLKAADRDALIPLVGNRLLFAQSRNPYVRSLGQFLSWAQAKTSQTNSLVARIENGDAKLAVRMLGLTTMYAGVQQLREWGKPSFDPTSSDRYMPLSTQGLKETAELSGNWLPWHINKIVRMIQPPFNQDLFANVSPSLGLLEDAWDSSRQIMNNIEDGDTEGVISNLLDVTPLGKEIKGYGKMPGVYDLYEIKDRPSRPSTRKRRRSRDAIGGIVEDVPGVPEEPDERIDKMTGRPYNEQAGGAFVDEEDRGPAEELDRLGYAEGGFFERARDWWDKLKFTSEFDKPERRYPLERVESATIRPHVKKGLEQVGLDIDARSPERSKEMERRIQAIRDEWEERRMDVPLQYRIYGDKVIFGGREKVTEKDMTEAEVRRFSDAASKRLEKMVERGDVYLDKDGNFQARGEATDRAFKNAVPGGQEFFHTFGSNYRTLNPETRMWTMPDIYDFSGQFAGPITAPGDHISNMLEYFKMATDPDYHVPTGAHFEEIGSNGDREIIREYEWKPSRIFQKGSKLSPYRGMPERFGREILPDERAAKISEQPYEQVDVEVNVPYAFTDAEGNLLSQEEQDDRWNTMMDKARSNAPASLLAQ